MASKRKDDLIPYASFGRSPRSKEKAVMRHHFGNGAIIVCITIVFATALVFILHLVLQSREDQNKVSVDQTRSLEDAIKILHFTDFHLDAYYDALVDAHPTSCRKLGNYSKAGYKAPYGRVNCDSPPALIDSLLYATKALRQDYDFVLMTGDFSAHGMDSSYFQNSTTPQRVLKNIRIGTKKIRKAFPSVPVFPMLGNNDLPRHYKIPESNTWYRRTLAMFAPLILCTGCPSKVPKPTSMKKLKKTFLDGGYYSVNMTTKDGQMVLIALNSIYWNGYARSKSAGSPEVEAVARRQMVWFGNQLRQAMQRKQKVVITGHIPPGIDPYDAYEDPSFWMTNFTHMYVNLVTGTYRNVIAGQLFAHTHYDDFHVQIAKPYGYNFKDNQLPPLKKSFAIFAPSVSPIYNNNPSFRVMYMDQKKQVLLDYDQYYMALVMATEFNEPTWQFSYRFSDHYPSSNPYINADRIYELNQGLLDTTTDKTWISYAFFRTVNYQPGSYSRFQLYCAMRYVYNEDYQKCKSEYKVPGG